MARKKQSSDYSKYVDDTLANEAIDVIIDTTTPPTTTEQPPAEQPPTEQPPAEQPPITPPPPPTPHNEQSAEKSLLQDFNESLNSEVVAEENTEQKTEKKFEYSDKPLNEQLMFIDGLICVLIGKIATIESMEQSEADFIASLAPEGYSIIPTGKGLFWGALALYYLSKIDFKKSKK